MHLWLPTMIALGLGVGCVSEQLPDEDSSIDESSVTDGSQNLDVVGCYATLAGYAYQPIDALKAAHPCNKQNTSDTRNGMGDYKLSTEQAATHSNVMQFWERESGNRRELLISLKGTTPSDSGDVVRDVQSQFKSFHKPEGNAISTPGADVSGKFAGGFYDRVTNLAPEVNTALTALETWRSQGQNREIGVKVTGHSLGAAVGTVMGLYVHERYKNDTHADVDVFAFNSPKTVDAAMQSYYQKEADSCDFNLHVFNNAQDVVSQVPLGAHQVYGDQSKSTWQYGYCRYNGTYNSGSLLSGISVPSALIAALNVFSATKDFVGSRHDYNQWISTTPQYVLANTPEDVSRRWFPLQHDIGGPPPGWALPGGTAKNNPDYGRKEISGSISAKLKSSSGHNLTNVKNDISIITSSKITTDTQFDFIVEDGACVADGADVQIQTRTTTPFQKSTGLFLSETNTDKLSPVSIPSLSVPRTDYSVFKVSNLTAPNSSCIAENDVISLQALATGKFIAVEVNGQVDVRGTKSSNPASLRFTVTNVTSKPNATFALVGNLEPGPEIAKSVKNGGTFSFQSKLDLNACVDVNGDSSAPYTKIQASQCDGTPSQVFHVVPNATHPGTCVSSAACAGLVEIVHPHSGNCVDVNGEGAFVGNGVDSYPCNNTDAQRFFVDQDIEGYVTFRWPSHTAFGYSNYGAPNYDFCLQPDKSSTADGTQVVLGKCDGSDAQKWLGTIAK